MEGQSDRRQGTADSVRAACITPAGIGGIAVVQVVGRSAGALVNPMLRAGRPLDVQQMRADELRLVRVVDGDETIDDALVAARGTAEERTVVEINLHGGPRIVQRVLLMLQRAGARIVEAADMLAVNWPNATPLERDLPAVLMQARTRAVALWLTGMPERLEAEVRQVIASAAATDGGAARARLARLCENAELLGWLLHGVRAVLIGGPNVGKSTLANALAAREHALVSDEPGTTRDWVEHPGAIDGVPFTFVDTAGLRDTTDPVEQEAVRRTREQIERADLVLDVCDVCSPPAERPHPPEVPGRWLTVWNKIDLTGDARGDWPSAEDPAQPVRISARTGTGLGQLRARMLQAVGLADWRERVVPYTAEHLATCRRALSELEAAASSAGGPAVVVLEEMLAGGAARNAGPGRGIISQQDAC